MFLELLAQKKMSDGRTRQNGSLVGGGEAEELENATADSARSITRSGVSYAATNVSDSRKPARKTEKTASEWKTGTETDGAARGNRSQFLGTSSSSRANLHMTRRASGTIPLEYTNSARKTVQSQKRVQMRTKRQREIDEVREKQVDLANHQHSYAAEKAKVAKR